MIRKTVDYIFTANIGKVDSPKKVITRIRIFGVLVFKNIINYEAE